MTATYTTPHTDISDLLSLCFEGGARRSRELRLSEEQVAYIKTHYQATIRPMGDQWYEISFMGDQ